MWYILHAPAESICRMGNPYPGQKKGVELFTSVNILKNLQVKENIFI